MQPAGVPAYAVLGGHEPNAALGGGGVPTPSHPRTCLHGDSCIVASLMHLPTTFCRDAVIHHNAEHNADLWVWHIGRLPGIKWCACEWWACCYNAHTPVLVPRRLLPRAKPAAAPSTAHQGHLQLGDGALCSALCTLWAPCTQDGHTHPCRHTCSHIEQCCSACLACQVRRERQPCNGVQ